MIKDMDKLCKACGQRRGAHSTSHVTGLIRCPVGKPISYPGYPGGPGQVWVEPDTITPTSVAYGYPVTISAPTRWDSKCQRCGRGTYIGAGTRPVEHDGGSCPSQA